MSEPYPIPDDLIGRVRRRARHQALAYGLRGADVDDYEGDALLALVLLAHEYDPARTVPFGAYVSVYLDARLLDIRRTKLKLKHKHRMREDPYPPLGDETSPFARLLTPDDEPPDVDFIWAAAATAQERTLLGALADGATKQDAAATLGVSPSRVSQLLAKLRGRLRPGSPATTRTRRRPSG